jgi:hypothetical protein
MPDDVSFVTKCIVGVRVLDVYFLCWCVRACVFCVGYIVLKLLVCDVAYVRMIFYVYVLLLGGTVRVSILRCVWFQGSVNFNVNVNVSTLSYCSKSHAMYAETGDRPLPGFHGTRPWPVNPLYTSYAD